jgi:hypothetical protein
MSARILLLRHGRQDDRRAAWGLEAAHDPPPVSAPPIAGQVAARVPAASPRSDERTTLPACQREVGRLRGDLATLQTARRARLAPTSSTSLASLT